MSDMPGIDEMLDLLNQGAPTSPEGMPDSNSTESGPTDLSDLDESSPFHMPKDEHDLIHGDVEVTGFAMVGDPRHVIEAIRGAHQVEHDEDADVEKRLFARKARHLMLECLAFRVVKMTDLRVILAMASIDLTQ